MRKKFDRLPEVLKDLVLEMGAFADARKVVLFLVGGSVRDMILGAGHTDLDFSVEGDGVGFALDLAKKWRVQAVIHRRFRTATLRTSEGVKIDIATARRESYETPGALPVVAVGTIHDDLFRRDFSINAMALCVNVSRFGELIDDFGGERDLGAGAVKTLHSLSFMDDPTRIVRAVRFEQRFDFAIEKNTLGALREAVKARMLERVQKHRLRDEILLVFKEAEPLKALERLHQLAGFSFISPGLRWEQSWRREFRAAGNAMAAFKASHPKRHVEPEALYLALFLARLPLKEAKAVMLDFAFHRAVSARVLSLVQHFPGIQRELSRADVRPSAAHRLLAPLSAEVALLVSVLSGSREVGRHVAYFLDGTSDLRSHLKGEDLKALGLKPGPRYKEILRGLLSARIDGELSGRDEEIAWVRAVLRDSHSTTRHSPR